MSPSEKILQLINGYKLSNALFAAAELKLFDYLDGKNTPGKIAGALKVDAKALEILLDVFCSAQLLEKDPGKSYHINPKYKKLITSNADTSMIPLIRLEGYMSETHADLSCLKQVLASGKGRDALNLNAKEGKEQTYGAAMNAGGQYSSLCIAREFTRLKTGTILDAGGGVGTHAIKICRFHDDIKIDVVDRAEMKEACIDNIRKSGFEDRISFITGDIREIRWKESYDGVLLSNVLHLFCDEENRKLIKKAANALRKNGILIMHDFFLPVDRTKESTASSYTLDWMLLGSFFHADTDIMKKWIHDAGLVFKKELRYERIPTSLVIAGK